MGTGDQSRYKKTSYVLDGESYETKFSPVALAELVEIDRALIARTEKASKNDDALNEAFEKIDVPCEFETIAVAENRTEIDARVGELIELIREHDHEQVVLDITFGFRSLPMVFFAAVLHLNALSNVEIGGIYYSEFQSESEVTPVIDMTHLHTLMEWYHAINTFERTGELRSVHGLLKERKVALCRDEDADNSKALEELVKKLNGTSRYFDSGIPLRAGKAAQDALATIQEIDNSDLIGPEERFLHPLSERLNRFSVDAVDDYTDIALDMDEIDRQRELVEFYAEYDRYRLALGCARELFINRFMLTVGIGLDEWIDRNNRECASRMINAKAKKQEEKNIDDIAAINLWQEIKDYRNWYAHSGFKADDIRSEDMIYNTVLELCEKIDDDEYWSEII
nr:TM1812 family CRISPR-associated protein [Halocatena pleomorpha]